MLMIYFLTNTATILKAIKVVTCGNEIFFFLKRFFTKNRKRDNHMSHTQYSIMQIFFLMAYIGIRHFSCVEIKICANALKIL